MSTHVKVNNYDLLNWTMSQEGDIKQLLSSNEFCLIKHVTKNKIDYIKPDIDIILEQVYPNDHGKIYELRVSTEDSDKEMFSILRWNLTFNKS